MPAETTDFYVATKCGRTFGWSAVDYSSLIRELHEKNYVPTFIQPMSEYEAEVLSREEQERLTDELHRAIDKELKHSA